jgi:hypothetical protein
MKTNATIEQLNTALEQVNKQYDGNIAFRETKQLSKNRVKFTLTVRDTRGPGHRRGFSGRLVKAACWHVHGHFFDKLIRMDPEIFVISGGNKRITSKGGNWQDWNIGSVISPLYFSQACDCY